MHSLFPLILIAIFGGHLINATEHLRVARITLGPRNGDLNVRQADQCVVATATPCADGNGCCPSGRPCTVIQQVPACGGGCGFGLPICPDGFCCELGQQCSLSLGNYYCVPSTHPTFHIPTNIEPTSIFVPTSMFPTPIESTTMVVPTSMFPTTIVPTGTPQESNSMSHLTINNPPTTSIISSAEPTTLVSIGLPTASSSNAAGEVVSTGGRWTTAFLAWLTGMLVVA